VYYGGHHKLDNGDSHAFLTAHPSAPMSKSGGGGGGGGTATQRFNL